MVLLRRVIGDALRARRQGQRRTLREVSTAANVSLGYLSEIERGQKEASSELLAAICDALGAQLSDLLRQVTDTLAMAEEMDSVLVPAAGSDIAHPATGPRGNDGASAGSAIRLPKQTESVNGSVSVKVRHDTALRATLRATRTPGGALGEFGRGSRNDDREREAAYAA